VASIEAAQLSLRVASALHDSKGAPITLLHVVRPGLETEAQARLQADLEGLEGIDAADFEVFVEALGPRRRLDNAILRAAKGYDLIIMGAPEEGLIQRAMFGDIPESVAKQVKIPVILTKRYTGAIKSWFQQLIGSRKAFLD